MTQTQDRNAFTLLLPFLACPACGENGESLEVSSEALTCALCATRFPFFRSGKVNIPWLFSEPGTARLEWKARYNGFLHANSVDLNRLRSARQVNHCSVTGRRRIDKLLLAHERYRTQITELLAPLELDAIDWPGDSANLLHGKLPKNQGLSSYNSNIFRDWAWNNGENEALAGAVNRVLHADRRGRLGSLLTLGAGAGRLSYDLHRHHSPALSVVSDFNPLLMQIASQVIQGESVSLYEFPIAPLNESSFAVLRECRAPVRLDQSEIHFVLADALNPPFGEASFDTIVTPWLIDIIPQNLREFVPRLNRLLRSGGVWVNTGSLAFFHRDESWCYSEEEVLEIVAENGFEILASERRKLSYLESPHSAHGRTEKILSFSAKKIREVEPEGEYFYVPDWILDTSRPVPATIESTLSASHHMLISQILAAIDGRRTIDQIGRLVARHYDLGTEESIHAVQRVLVDAWEDSHIGKADGSL